MELYLSSLLHPPGGPLEHLANGSHAGTRSVSNISQSNDCPKSIDRFLTTLSCDGGVTACDYDMSVYCVTGMLIPPIEGIIMRFVLWRRVPNYNAVEKLSLPFVSR